MVIKRCQINNMISNEDIVISGISGRLPESSNIDEFKENLLNKIDMITDDDRRWSASEYELPNRFGKLKNLSNFDASFFGIHPKQAHAMDPQVRILLEATYEAIIDAGINPSTIRGSRTGVFTAVSLSDSEHYWLQNKSESSNGYEMLGTFRAMVANRISFAFDFIGPSCTVDTACSASMFAIHMAVSAIRSGECDAAIVGGLHIMLIPKYSIYLNKMGILSQDGKCKTFDAAADGYVRSEGIVAIYLQRVKNARRVYATLVHTKTNTDGYKPQGIMHPKTEMHMQLLRELYDEAGINPADVVYVEAHGTGTPLGDFRELNVIDEIFCRNRTEPLLIGSVRSNMGHAEAVSGLCSIAKILIAMETGMIPANLHFSNPNPKIPALSEGRIRVIDKITPWSGGLAAINSFGFGGVNVHIILRSNPKAKLLPSLSIIDTLPKLIIASGRTVEAVHVLLNEANNYSRNNEFLSLLHMIHNSNILEHKYRGYAILDNNMREISEVTNYNIKRPIWFVFCGMGAQWSGMGRDLLKIEVCKRSLQRCADVLISYNIDIIDMIINSTNEIYNNVTNSMILIVAIQIALVDMLRSINIHPDGIIGHSLGETCCGYADGTFTLEETIMCAYYRSRSIMESKIEPGTMAVIGLSWEEVKKICPPDIIPACHNSLNAVTVSGPSKSMQVFTEELKRKGIFTTIVNTCGIAFHSKYINIIVPKLRAFLEKMITHPKPRSTRWISTSVPEALWHSPSARLNSAEYHINNMMSPVFFQEAIARIPKNAIVLEIAPHCIFQMILCKSLPETVINISFQKRNNPDNVMFLLSSIGKLYMAGAQPDVSKLYPPVEFPVSPGTPMIGSLIKWDHSVEWKVPIFKKKQHTSEHSFKIDLSKESYAYLAGHKIDGKIILPGSMYCMMIWKTFARLHNMDFEQFPVVFENIQFQRITIIPKEGTIEFLVNIFKKTGMFEICESDSVIISGNVRAFNAFERDQLKISPLMSSSANKNFLPLNTKDVYKELSLRGYDYRGLFRGIKSCNNYLMVGELHWFKEWVSYIDTIFQFSILNISSRKLMYGSRVQYIAIDPIRHKQLVSKLSEGDSLPIHYYKNIDIIKSGGIEIRGLKPISPQRMHLQTNLKYKRQIFVPYENPCILAEDSINGILQALSILLQITYENITTSQINVIEIAGERTMENLLAPHVLNILHNKPLCTIKLQVITVSADNYTENFKQNLNIDVITQNTNNTFPANNAHLIIAADILSGQSYNVLKNLAIALMSGSFLLLEENGAPDLKAVLQTGLILIGKQSNSVGKTYLLLKKPEKKREQIVINITEKNLLQLDSLKSNGQDLQMTSLEVLFVSQGKKLYDLIELMTRHEVDGIKARYILIQDKNAPAFNPSAQFYADQLDKGLTVNVLKRGSWGSYRDLQLDQQSYVQTEHAYVNALKGNLNTLTWIPIKEHILFDISSNTRRCSVYYAAINTRDVMLVSKLSLDIIDKRMEIDPVLGVEYSGRVMDGRRVMGIVKAGGLATTVLGDSDFIWEIPDKWTLEEAATIPVAYAISYYALFVRSHLKVDDSILIQIGMDGIGYAAIAIALHISCTVYIIVSTSDQREHIKKIFPQVPNKRIGISGDISFEQSILIETQERGVNVMLNSLAKEKSPISAKCLATNGHFIEIGDCRLRNDYFLKTISYHVIGLEALFEKWSEKKEVARLVSQGIENGTIQPLTSVVFSDQQLEQGFKLLLTNEYTGKVLLKVRDEESDKDMVPTPKLMSAIPRTYMNPEKSYILIGGLEGLGLELADWMITRGAKYIVLVTSSDAHSGYQALCLRRWNENGINVMMSTKNVTVLSDVEQLIRESNQLAPVGGIFNLATTLDDTLIGSLQEAYFKTLMLPKIDGIRNLDSLSTKLCPSLDYFVVFSYGYGNVAQCNLAFEFMDKMIEQRQAAGLPGLAIQLDAIEEIDTLDDKDIARNGILPQRISSCLETIDIFLQQSHQILSSTVIAEKHKSTDDSKDDFNEIIKVITRIFGIKDINSNLNDSFINLGIDSLNFVEIQQILEKKCNISLSFEEISSLTMQKLKDLSLSNAKSS